MVHSASRYRATSSRCDPVDRIGEVGATTPFPFVRLASSAIRIVYVSLPRHHVPSYL